MTYAPADVNYFKAVLGDPHNLPATQPFLAQTCGALLEYLLASQFMHVLARRCTAIPLFPQSDYLAVVYRIRLITGTPRKIVKLRLARVGPASMNHVPSREIPGNG